MSQRNAQIQFIVQPPIGVIFDTILMHISIINNELSNFSVAIFPNNHRSLKLNIGSVARSNGPHRDLSALYRLRDRRIRPSMNPMKKKLFKEKDSNSCFIVN